MRIQFLWFLTAVSLLLLPSSAPAQSRNDGGAPADTPLQDTTAENNLIDEQALDLEEFSRTEVFSLMSSIYRSQAEILAAHAREDSAAVETLLDEAMEDLLRLSRGSGVDTLTRYRELFRSVVSEYEDYYGTTDSLAPALGNIFAFRTRMFASMNELSEPLLEDISLLREIGPVSTTVPMTINRLVEASITYLMREPEKHVHSWMARSDTYLPMIEEIFAEEGVPDELKYLAMIESGLNPRARSWARAVGMWQFISATGRHYGLRVDNWIDERMDPEKSTRAAARHLKDLYNMFGDWHLALAGYNYSPGKLRRHVRRVERNLDRKATFWDVYRYIPRETRNYVPMFIATALVLSQPDVFKIEKTDHGPTYEYHHVPVYGMLSLQKVAEMTDSNVATIRALNPELRRSTLPPSRSPYWVRIPYGSYETFSESYRALPESARRPLDEHVVRRGETLSQIASRYGVGWRQLMNNNGLRSSRIRPGQRLAVPLRDYGTPTGGDLASDGGVTVRYGSRLIRPIAAAKEADIPATAARLVEESQNEKKAAAVRAQRRSQPPPGSTRIVYTVRKGDTLGEIAEQYGTTAQRLRDWNNIRGSRIRVGQKLYLYVKSNASSQSSHYTVRRGDNLAEIAKKHGVSVASLKSWNGLKTSVIHPGQRLAVRAPSSGGGEATTYRVKRGDSLTRIASQFGVTVSQIKTWNNLKSSRIIVGQRLKIRS
jgi:membrane-bound lytic murein transglycosylase D